MNVRDLLLLEKHNSRPARRAWHNGRRSIDWYAVVLPAGIFIGSMLTGALLWWAFRYFRVWWPL